MYPINLKDQLCQQSFVIKVLTLFFKEQILILKDINCNKAVDKNEYRVKDLKWKTNKN